MTASKYIQTNNAITAPMLLSIQLSPELRQALDSAPAEPSEVQPEVQPEVRREAQPERAPMAPQREPSLEFLRDVELAATVRFGRRDVPLREILELTAGAVVELEQRVEEPVELLVGQKVVARGEVVVVDGSYGLRVTEVVGPAERIESLRG